MKFRVQLDPEAVAPILRSLPPATKRRIRDALRSLAEDPMGSGGQWDVRELDRDGKEPRVYRLRMGDWRIVFLLRENEILVMKIFHRRDGYGWLERFDPPTR